jgi:cobalt/nickel transport system permease protein
MNSVLPSFLQTSENRLRSISDKKKGTFPFIDKTLKNVAGFIKTGYIQNDTASKKGLFQQLDARIKVIFLLFFIVIISFQQNIPRQLFITAILFILYVLSWINLAVVYKKLFLFSFFFGFLVIVPACLNIITDGKIIIFLIRFNAPHRFWFYHLPSTIGLTKEGCILVTKFFLRVFNSLALAILIFYTTPFNETIKALGTFRVPQLFLMVITLAYKFIFILSQTTEETYLALKSRWWSSPGVSGANELVAGRIVYIFRRSWLKYEEIYKAMLARGFSGKVNLCYPKKFRWKDAAFLILLISVALLCYLI